MTWEFNCNWCNNRAEHMLKEAHCSACGDIAETLQGVSLPSPICSDCARLKYVDKWCKKAVKPQDVLLLESLIWAS